ncbi:MAG TPA: Rieske (2Fe-2S) protein [Aggregatilinea sp.]|uniref:QcrA and Rieske domain-containing protein n=1 Tax=Aggregatilinea sp. TaxID=2806333 RepID=UPI002D0596B9|nr:Rieske (2Fe-2S) protein [Aggregatilinea sp.]HML21953.1 Rieske (2Fe-2S) protein [Aggregatilinea sp.]
MDEMPRRDFLRLVTQSLLGISGLLGLGGLVRYLDFQGETAPPEVFELGAAADYPPGSSVVLPDVPAVLIHDEAGFRAMSLVCTHLGCTVEPDAAGDGYVCPCHGSRYDAAGVARRGPASDALPTLRVEVTDDEQVRLYRTS